MTDTSRPTPQRLQPGQFLRLRRRPPMRLRALQGTLWITVDGQIDDFVLQPGECHTFAAGARLLVTAIDGAATLTAAPMPRTPAWREHLAAFVHRLGRRGAEVGA